MNIDIRKEEFLNLCEALEKGIITIEQFKILSDLENKSEMSALINIKKYSPVFCRRSTFFVKMMMPP